jgi:hypothetical protein
MRQRWLLPVLLMTLAAVALAPGIALAGAKAGGTLKFGMLRDPTG